MSTLLEQAIVDAGALRNAALKNAESAVIEKYSDQIKEAVEAILLEQPEEEEDPMAGMEDPMAADPMAAGEAPEPEPVVDDMPLGANDGENLCPCPDDEEEIEINFDDLSREMEKYSEIPGETHDMAAGEVLGSEEEFMQEVNLDEDILASLLEELTVDIHPTKSGWAGTPNAMVNLAEEELMALAQDSKEKEKREAIENALKDLQESKNDLESKNKLLKEKLQTANGNIKKLAEVVTVLKGRLDESSLSNAKLLYTNRVLSNDSLNERQKNHIVEALTKSENVEEAKTIYDTLQNTVSSTKNKKQLNSLSEAVNKTSSTLILSRRQEQQRSDPSLDRWKTLAGLNNNNN
jgi:hypothetical protein|tara:strand:+ start:44923 stop:45972 length:1050 start_codon:yes stop_codon:yes gene_type:complete